MAGAIEIIVRRHDIDEADLHEARRTGQVAWDIETTGLDWRADQIGTCQIALPDRVLVVQLAAGEVPTRLAKLLADGDVLKIFHHAPFDLRFMTYQWGVASANIACTKVASKIIEPGLEHDRYSLKWSLLRHLNVRVDKSERLSDWANTRLSNNQVEYAARDVLYLADLLATLKAQATAQGVGDLVDRSFAYLPTRVELDIRGLEDVYTY